MSTNKSAFSRLSPLLTKKVLYPAATVALLAVGFLGGQAFSTGKPAPAAVKSGASSKVAPAMQTTVASAVMRTFYSELRTDATFALPAGTVVLVAEASGKLIGTLPSVGTAVKKGQLLATIESQEIQIKEQELRSEVERTSVIAADAQKTFTDYEVLAAKDYVSKSQLRTAQRDYQTANQSVDGAKARLMSARATSSKTRLVAPQDGIVGATPLVTGQYIRAGDQLLEIVPSTKLELVLALPQNWQGKVSVGSEVVLTEDRPGALPVENLFEVIRVQPNVSNNKTLKVYAQLKNGEALATWAPGLTVAAVVRAQPMDYLALPEEAVSLEGSRQSVFLIEAGKAKLQQVKRVTDSHGWVAVTGIELGQTVALSSAGLLRDGQAVNVTAVTTKGTK